MRPASRLRARVAGLLRRSRDPLVSVARGLQPARISLFQRSRFERVAGMFRRSRDILASVARGLQPARISLFRRSRFEAEMAEELAEHLRTRTEALVAQGLSPDQAGRQARLEFGGVEVQKERCREAWGLRLIDDLSRDVRYSFRSLRRSPTFTIVAVLTLALALGASVSIFSLLDALVFRELPVSHPEQLVQVGVPAPPFGVGGVSFSMFDELRRSQTVFSSLIGYWGDGVLNVDAGGELARADIWAVTGNFYDELGVRPSAGRLLTPDDVRLETLKPSMVAVLGYGFWRRHFGDDRSIIGRSIEVEGVPFTVIGIAPEGFKAFSLTVEPDVTIPLTAEPVAWGRTIDSIRSYPSLWVSMIGRLEPGMSLARARAELEARWSAIKAAAVPAALTGHQRDEFLGHRLDVESAARGHEWYLRHHFTAPLAALLAIALLILLIACVNLAGLTLSRASARAQEIDVRRALGAGRWTIIRQMLMESLMLSVAGVALGLPLALWSSRIVSAMMLQGYLVPAWLDLPLDPRVMAFAIFVTVLTTLLIGFVPAWRVTRGESTGGPRSGARIAGAGRRAAGTSLMIVQVALSVVLLVTAGLMVRTLQALRTVYNEVNQHGLAIAGMTPTHLYKGVDPDSYYPRLLERINSLPGVAHASLASVRPFWGSETDKSVARASLAPSSSDVVEAASNSVSPGFFATLGLPLLAGRDFTWQDNAKAPQVAIVSERLASRLFPKASALGESIRIGTEADHQRVTIVGIVADRMLYDPRSRATASVYIPQLQAGEQANWNSLVLRASTSASVDLKVLQQTVQSFGNELVLELKPAPQAAARALLQERVMALLAECFGGLALILIAIGIYGLMAYTVTRRTREIGIRIALGARLSVVVGSIVGGGLRLTLIGVIVGLGAALATTRFVRALLFGVGPADPLTLVLVPALLFLVAALAALVPALRAARVDPAVTLRSE